jgi:hypothetical protein
VLQGDDPELEALAHDLTVQWNSGLAQVVADLDQPGLALFDVAKFFEGIISDPGGFGFTNIQGQAITSGGNDDEFLFWDGVHPTAATHRLLATQLLAEFPFLAPCPPKITRISHDRGSRSIRIVFDSHPDARYAIEYSANLAGDWSVLDGDFGSQGVRSTFQGETVAGRGFYRIRIVFP